MAVPDWPNTYGWNMFLYPPSTWLYGGFDLLVEHGHRLLASLAGLISIALCMASFRTDCRRWFRWWSAGVLLAVILQGSLGGVRVLLDERLVAMVHGCAAQLFLAMVTATAVMSSRWWIAGGRVATEDGSIKPSRPIQPASRFQAGLLSFLLVLAYCQVIAGASLRHVPNSTLPGTFMGLVHLHLLMAGVVFLTSLVATWRVLRVPRLWGGVKTPVLLILLTVLIQLTLGFGTWLVNYALPWQELNQFFASYTISAKGYWESILVTSHVATGAMIISLTTMSAVRAWRSRAIFSENEVT